MTTEQLRTFLADRSMTQKELAQALGVSEEHLSRVMHNGPQVPHAILGRFVLAFPEAAATAITTTPTVSAAQ